jgi:dolichol-phosphate mannosyltransferase
MPELAVVIPTLNERKNVQPLLEKLELALSGVEWEAVFVDDDSKDGTADLLRSIGLRDPRVRVLQRIGRRGLSSAAIEGMMATAAPYVAVMDADLQHDETLLPKMLGRIKQDQLDLVVGSRNVGDGSMGDFSAGRQRLSNLGRTLSRLVCRQDVSDPMSGFFMVSRRFLEEVVHNLSGLGFKILVDLVASSPRPVKLAEMPYRFGERLAGESKLDTMVGIEYLLLLIDKAVGDYIPARFVLFAIVGAFGLIVHLAVLGTLLATSSMTFLYSHSLATFVAMTFNFLVNNYITYRDRKLRGWGIVSGLLWFYAACALGALSNFGLAQLAYSAGVPWWIAGAAGMMVSSVWNYGVTAAFSWRTARRKARMFRAAPARSEAEAAR